MPDDQGLPKDPLDLDKVDREIRMNEITSRLNDMGMESMHVNGDCPPEVHEQFLRNVMDFESAPLTTQFHELVKLGVALPAPETLDDDALHAKLWEVINALAKRDAYLSHTDHLSDRELYEHLWNDSLREENASFPAGSGWVQHIDIIGGCSEEDLEISHRYYDSEEDREHWAKEFPNDAMPPREEPPFDRDRLLPQSPNDQPCSGDFNDEWEECDDECGDGDDD